jgi:hypothetical protein
MPTVKNGLVKRQKQRVLLINIRAIETMAAFQGQ